MELGGESNDIAEVESKIGCPTKIAFIGTASTASASELVINSLSPHINVQVVGETTCGKPVGMYGKTFCGKRIQPIEFITANSDGFSDYFDGFTPQCDVTDDWSRPLGNIAENMLNTAITFTRTGQCPAQADNKMSNTLSGKNFEEEGAKMGNSL